YGILIVSAAFFFVFALMDVLAAGAPSAGPGKAASSDHLSTAAALPGGLCRAPSVPLVGSARPISTLKGTWGFSTFRAVSTPPVGRPEGSRIPSRTRTEAWSQ